MLCKICGDELDTKVGLKNHLYFKHPEISTEQYTLKYLYNDERPTCACGCGQETRYSAFSFKKYCKGHNANRKGAKLSDEVKKSMSESKKKFLAENPEHAKDQAAHMRKFNQTPEAIAKRHESRWSKKENREKQSKSMKQRYVDNPNLKNQISENLSEWHTIPENKESFKETHGKEWKEKISKSITEKYLSGGFEWSKGKRFSTKMNKTFYYRSSWEKRYMEQLDEDPSVIKWKYEPFSIPYKKDEANRRYIPDFFIEYADGRKELHEIGVQKVKENFCQEKMKAGEEFCNSRGYSFKIIEL